MASALSTFTELDKFILLANNDITGSFNLNASSVPPDYYGSSNVTPLGGTFTTSPTLTESNTFATAGLAQYFSFRNQLISSTVVYTPPSLSNITFNANERSRFNSALTLNNIDITLDCQTLINPFFIISVQNAFTFSGTTNINIIHGSTLVENIIWEGEAITIENTSNLYGVFMGSNGITISTPFSSNITGRLYSVNGPITNNSGSEVTVIGNDVQVCYAKGTLILTDQGLVPIENIKECDSVVTNGKIHNMNYVTSDKFKIEPLVWISSFKVHFLNSNSRPICIKKHALRKNVPFQDLYVSPSHSILINDKMVLARNLVNGTTIYQDNECTEVEYYHLECKEHYAIFANGVLAESYFDDNNRYVFENKNKPLLLHNDICV